jgi:phosphatidate cytidylyltransferase
MLATRLVSGSVLIAVVLVVLLVDERFAPWFPLWFCLSFTALLAAALELVDLLGHAGVRPSTNSVVGGVAALVVANWMPHLPPHLEWGSEAWSLLEEPLQPISVLSWPLLAFTGVLMVSFVVQSVQFCKPGRTMMTIAATILVDAYVGLLGTFIIQMRWLEGSLHGVVPILLLIATAKGADTGAFIFGKLAGRRKLWPVLSPNKTIEGAAGGLLVAILGAILVTTGAERLLDIPSLNWTQTIAFGLIVGLVAQLGDLMESMIKRDCEQKDASSAIPGFGGVLDVLDSLLFSAPVAFVLWLGFSP